VQEAVTAQRQPQTRGAPGGTAGLRWVYDRAAPGAIAPAEGHGTVAMPAGTPATLSLAEVYGERRGVSHPAPRERSPDGRAQGTAGDLGVGRQSQAEAQRSKDEGGWVRFWAPLQRTEDDVLAC
jgi:hypothetical protein